MRNYKVVLLGMEAKALIETSPPSNKRRKGTFSDKVRIMFPSKMRTR
jgi:hypothetical protein